MQCKKTRTSFACPCHQGIKVIYEHFLSTTVFCPLYGFGIGRNGVTIVMESFLVLPEHPFY